jgi:ribonuclease BN (tRNA processing enzyme)
MGTVNITILGSGTSVPSLYRSSPSLLVELEDVKILLDLGNGAMRRLLQIGIEISEITHILLSHLHPDHTGDLVPFIFATKYPETYRRRTPFLVAGSKGLKDFYRGLTKVYGHWIELEPELMRLQEFDNTGSDRLNDDRFDVYTLPLDHIESSIGFRIVTADDVTVVYTGDTDVCENVVRLAREADIFICESALPDELKVTGHLTPSLAGEIATRADVKQLILTHFYPECDTVDIESQCRKTYTGPLILARDLLQFTVDRAGSTVTNAGVKKENSA